MPNDGTLIVGGDGIIGGAYADHLRHAGRPFVSTTRRRTGSGEALFLDLSEPSASWRLPSDTASAVICAAVTSGAACAEDPARSRLINVDAVGVLTERLAARDCFSILLSTSQVFDGGKLHPAEDDPTSPLTEYGRQKADAESRVLATDRAAVLRLTKLVTPQLPLFRDWIATLNRGEAITAFGDMVCAPVGSDMVCTAIDAILAARAPGVFHLSATKDITYVEAAAHLARRLGADERLVATGTAAASGIGPEMAPAHTALACNRLEALLEFGPPEPFEPLDGILRAGPA